MKQTQIASIDLRLLAPDGATVKVAYEQYPDGFALGIVFPDGQPWVFRIDVTTIDEVQAYVKACFEGKIVQYINRGEYNRLKALYRRQRAMASRSSKKEEVYG